MRFSKWEFGTMLRLPVVQCGDKMANDRFVCLFAALTLVASKARSYSEWARKSLRSDRRARRNHKEANSDVEQTTEAFLTRRKAKEKAKSCCQNGGLCIMNSFCHCKKGFYGRHCEHVVQYRRCGTMEHGTWMSAACTLCYCFDGRMACKALDSLDCDKGGYSEGLSESPEYEDGVDQKSRDYDTFYDGYEEDYATTAGGRQDQPGVVWTVLVGVLTLVLPNS